MTKKFKTLRYKNIDEFPLSGEFIHIYQDEHNQGYPDILTSSTPDLMVHTADFNKLKDAIGKLNHEISWDKIEMVEVELTIK